MQSLGEKIRQARREKGLTQEQLAQALFVSRQTVSNWENGKTEPDYQTLVRLSQELGMEIVRTEETPAEAPPETPPEMARQPDEKAAPPAPVAGGRWRPQRLRSRWGLSAAVRRPEKRADMVEWFQQEAADVPDQAFVRIYTKAALPVAIKQQTAESTPVWEYNLFIREENGVGVTVSELTCVRFYKSGKTDIYATTVDVFGERNGGKPSYIGGREMRRLSCGRTADRQSIGEGWMLRGTDDHGNPVCFYDLYSV